MSDHPSTIEGALKWADVSKKCFDTDEPTMDSIALQTLADAYRSEKQDADDLEDYVAELVAQVNKEKARADQNEGIFDALTYWHKRSDLLEHQYSELADYMVHHSNERYEDMSARHKAERKK